MTAEPEGARRFGDYELLRYFTAGGMADLYLARHPRFGERSLILKRIQARYLDHTRVVKMFIDEGRIAGILDHPNIVRVLDVGQHDGVWYIAMEHIHGHDLVAVARRSSEAGIHIPRAFAVGVLTQVAAGLDYAHTKAGSDGRPLNIVHCDVSPGNVVISFRGVVKIVDFGIARATIALREEDGVAGKYNYMAPEQVKGERFDARADLFPLGVMLYELTVGRRLFRGRPEVVMRRVCEDPIPLPSDMASDYPRALEKIVMRLLERDIDKRYPSAGAAHADLVAYLRDEEQGSNQQEISRFLRSLFAAPVSETSDPSVIVEDLEVDRGMPEMADAPLSESEDEERASEIGRPVVAPAAVNSGAPVNIAPANPGAPVNIAPVNIAPVNIAPVPQPRRNPTPSPRKPTPPPRRPIDDGPTAAIALPVDEVRRERLPVEETKLVQLPESRRKGGKGGAGGRAKGPKRPGPDDATMLVTLPEERTRSQRAPRVYLSTGVVVGGCMILAALVLLVLWFLGDR